MDQNEVFYPEDPLKPPTADASDKTSQAVSVRVIQYLLYYYNETREQWEQFYYYWWLLNEFSKLGHRQRRFLIRRGVVGMLVDYYMGNNSPYRRKTPKSPLGGYNTDLSQFFQLFKSLVVGTPPNADTSATENNDQLRPPTAYKNETYVPLLPCCINLLYFQDNAFESMLKLAYHAESMRYILHHICWESKLKTLWAFERISQAFDTHGGEYPHAKNALDNMGFLLEINDTLQPHRLELALNPSQKLSLFHLLKQNKDRKSRGIICDELITLVKSNDSVSAYLHQIKSDWWDSFRKEVAGNEYFVGHISTLRAFFD